MESSGVFGRMKASDGHELFISLLAKHGGMLRGMIRSGVRLPSEVDDLMQRVSLIAWKKFEQLDKPDDFPKWACAIARFEIMKFRRERARDRLSFNDKVVDLLASEAEEESSLRERRIQLLEACLKELPDDRRKLILQAYDSSGSMKELASQTNRSPDALYQTLHRLRMVLMLCVEKRMAEGEG